MKLIDKIKNDPRVSKVWSEGEDDWWCDLRANWISSDTETGTLHEEKLEHILSQLNHGSVRLRHYEADGGEITDGCAFNPNLPPFVRAEERFIKLTPFQTWLLADRPEDCLEENLREQNPELSEEKLRLVVWSVTRLFRYSRDTSKGHLGYLASTIDVYALSRHQRDVLEDCFSGSTVCCQVAHLHDNPDPKERALYWHAVRSVHCIADKFRKAGLESRFIPDG